MEVAVTPLGAGCEVGRSCVLVTIGGRTIMMDCGMHMGYRNHKMVPDLGFLEGGKVDVVLISHFHLDHCGALPFLTEVFGYDGPVLMTRPTASIAPLLLRDMVKISKGLSWGDAEVEQCMKKVQVIDLHETVYVGNIAITAFYAGHVLGACMFRVEVEGQSVVYSGDYNSDPDRHLCGAFIPPHHLHKNPPTVFITESTYGSVMRDSKRAREREFLELVHRTVHEGGKVLIPVFALGRAQELLILLNTYWDRCQLGHIPIYFSPGLVSNANEYYELYVNWMNDAIRGAVDPSEDIDTPPWCMKRAGNAFSLPHVHGAFDKAMLDHPTPMVLFSTPGMLHAGLSLQAFKKWCTSEKNTVIIPGHCVDGTIGAKVLAKPTHLRIDDVEYRIKCRVAKLSFSAHADARGILKMTSMLNPHEVVLVHGDLDNIKVLSERVKGELHKACHAPRNGDTKRIACPVRIPLQLSTALLPAIKSGRDLLEGRFALRREVIDVIAGLRGFASAATEALGGKRPREEQWWERWFPSDEIEGPVGPCDVDCMCDLPTTKEVPMITESCEVVCMVSEGEAGSATVECTSKGDFLQKAGLREHTATFTASLPAPLPGDRTSVLPSLHNTLRTLLPTVPLSLSPDALSAYSITLTVPPEGAPQLSWRYPDHLLATRFLEILSDTLGVAA